MAVWVISVHENIKAGTIISAEACSELRALPFISRAYNRIGDFSLKIDQKSIVH